MSGTVSNISTKNSIVNGKSSEPKLDSNTPYVYMDWLSKVNLGNIDKNSLFVYYNQYLLLWNKVKNQTPESIVAVKAVYTNLLKELSLRYSNEDERRILSNIDFSSKRDIAIALPFFSRKMRQLCEYYILRRERTKNAVRKYNSKCTVESVKMDVRDILFDTIREANKSLYETILNSNIYVGVDELYSNTSEFFDKVDNSFYNGFPDIDVMTDQFMCLADGKTIADLKSALNEEYAPDTSVSFADFVASFADTDFMYIDTETGKVDVLVDVDKRGAKAILNRSGVSLAMKDEEELLLTERDLGGFFTPKYLGVLFFNSLDLTYTINKTKMQSGGVYIFPNPKFLQTREYNNEELPVIWISNTDKIKVSNISGFKHGQVLFNSYYNSYHGYESQSQTLLQQNNSISSKMSSYDFWHGPLNAIFNGINLNGALDISGEQAKIPDLDNVVPIWYGEDNYGGIYGAVKNVGDIRADNDTKHGIMLVNTADQNLLYSAENLEGLDNKNLNNGTFIPQVGSPEYNSVTAAGGYTYIFCSDLGVTNYGYVPPPILRIGRTVVEKKPHDSISYDIYGNKFILGTKQIMYKNASGSVVGDILSPEFGFYQILNQLDANIFDTNKPGITVFSVFGDVFMFECDTSIIFCKFVYDSTTDSISPSSVTPVIISKLDDGTEQFSSVWMNGDKLLFSKSTVIDRKLIHTIHSFDYTNYILKTEYSPNPADAEYIIAKPDEAQYEILSICKPTMHVENGIMCVSTVVSDLFDMKYLTEYKYKVNRRIKLSEVLFYTPFGEDIYYSNFRTLLTEVTPFAFTNLTGGPLTNNKIIDIDLPDNPNPVITFNPQF